MKCSLILELILFLKVVHFTWNLTDYLLSSHKNKGYNVAKIHL